MKGALVTVELGRLDHAVGEGMAGRLLYLPGRDAIVAIRQVRSDGCSCRVLARRHPGRSLDEIIIGHADICTATTTYTVDPTDGDGYAMLWQARVDQHDPDGVLPHLARRLAEENRVPGGRIVDLTVTMAGFDHSGPSGIVIAALRLHLQRMIAAGFLGPALGETAATGWGPFTLTIPEANHDQGATPRSSVGRLPQSRHGG